VPQRSCLAWLAALVVLGSIAAAAAATPAWKPQDSVEIIVGAGAGGGNDNIARTMQKIMQDRRLVEAPSTVVNKAGGGGTIAYSYLGQRRANGHYIAISSNTLLTNHITGISPISYTDFTPLAIMINEYISFVVKSDSPLTTGRDLIAKLKSDPSTVVFGISSTLGNINHIAAAVVARAGGIDVKKMKVVVFNSSAASITALLGGHVDVVTGPPSISAKHVEAGKLRSLGITSPRRLRGILATQPTWREQGIDAVVINWRGVVGAQGIGAPQIAFWDETFGKLARTDEWDLDLERNLWENVYIDSRGTTQYLKTQYDELKHVLTELGFVK
jgi:putative tricarboxylic transport membrane protein